MANPLIDNCPEDPTLAAAYLKGATQVWSEVRGSVAYLHCALYRDWLAELQNHVLRLMRDRGKTDGTSPQ